MNLKYYILRLRDALFPPRTTHELWMWNKGEGKYSYIKEKRREDLQKAWRRNRKNTRY